MKRNLEYRIKNFRGRMMGRNLSEKYLIEFSEDGTTIIQSRYFSVYDFAKFISNFLGKLMVPYFGDKSVIEWVKLESEINPKKKVEFYVSAGIFMAGKCGLLYTLLDRVF